MKKGALGGECNRPHLAAAQQLVLSTARPRDLPHDLPPPPTDLPPATPKPENGDPYSEPGRAAGHGTHGGHRTSGRRAGHASHPPAAHRHPATRPYTEGGW